VFEVELKVRTDHDSIRDALGAAGVELGVPHGQRDTYFDAPHRNFAETDEAVRVRRASQVDGPVGSDIERVVREATADGQATVTYKGPLIGGGSKTREEVETAVENGDAITSIFEQLGFTAVATVSKVRETGQFEGYTIALDRVAGVGEFVEVERTVEEDAIEAARVGARRCLEELGVDPDRGIQTSYLELLLDG
jgi:adenylate cyclase class 2